MVRICDRCNKVLASPQSMWNHRQRCSKKQDQPNKDKILGDILNKVDQRANDRSKSCSVKSDFKMDVEKMNIDPESDSEENESSEESDEITDKQEKLFKRFQKSIHEISPRYWVIQ